MSFTTTLFRLIKSADLIELDGYEAESFDLEWTNRLDPHDTILQVRFDMSEFDLGFWTFRNQAVVVDVWGYCQALCTEDDDTHSFEFRVSRPIQEGDLT